MNLRWIKHTENNPVTEGCISCKSSNEKCLGQSKQICLLGWARGWGEGDSCGLMVCMDLCMCFQATSCTFYTLQLCGVGIISQ